MEICLNHSLVAGVPAGRQIDCAELEHIMLWAVFA